MNWILPTLLLAAAGITPEDQASLDYWLTFTTIAMVVIVVGLGVLTVAIRHVAARYTHPCRWCMEFIPKSAAVCPRCGKELATDDAAGLN